MSQVMPPPPLSSVPDNTGRIAINFGVMALALAALAFFVRGPLAYVVLPLAVAGFVLALLSRTDRKVIGIVLNVGAALLVMGQMSIADPSAHRHNARCTLCGHEFTIPEHHGIGRLTNTYSCPNCGMGGPAEHLYKK